MKITRALIILLVLVSSSPSMGAQSDSEIDPKDIINRVDRLLRGASSHGEVEMNVVTKRWKRSMAMEIWSLGTEKSLVRISKPKKEAGTATLKVDKDIWNYLPKIDRTIRVPSSMMMGAWMGSHFTNDDLVKDSQLVLDYDIELTHNGDRDGVDVYEFKLRPKPEAPVVWGEIRYQVVRESLIPVWARYYDEEGELKRTMTFSDIREFGGRRVPSVMRLVPADEPNEYTEMVYRSLEFDIKIEDRTFSLAALRK